ncbi:SWIRM domain-containing protein FUN19 [Cytospora mali]|uniref:SWIRM domain-containing protein FUN19 n=1 Tax=Cytospora mali TaxID=578113 RepID=A0A194VZ05_CYTMA|nr:SWIRM domain-containing protein FUN19 [Valsa mali]
MAASPQFDGSSTRTRPEIAVAPTYSKQYTAAHSQSRSSVSATMQSKNPLAISNLMISPPEQAPLESFRQVPEPFQPISMQPPTKPKQTNPQLPASPPVSPWTKAGNQISGPSTTHDATDPILYPEAPASPSSPLFIERRLSPEAQNAVFEHIAARRVSPLPDHVTPPRRQDYELALYLKENFYQIYQRDPRGLLKRNREELRRDARARALSNPTHSKSATQPVIHAKPLMARPSGTIVARPNVVKHATSPRTPSKVTKPPTGPRPVRAQTAKPARRVSSTPEPRSRLVPPNREDKDFNSIPDFCPPLSSLPDRPNSLKVDWKGNALDLSKDPHRHLLHPDELQLAASLRLDCATYLTSKRRIFEARLDYYHKGKEFRKTHAQQACKIDVNKASKLHMAYERVGWFDKKWMLDLPSSAH